MNSLIYLYDSFLIYYSNIFFLTLFLVGILGLVILRKAVILLNKSKKAGKRKSFSGLPVNKTLKSLLGIIINLFALIDKALTRLQSYIEKVMKKIKKEIFIEE